MRHKIISLLSGIILLMSLFGTPLPALAQEGNEGRSEYPVFPVLPEVPDSEEPELHEGIDYQLNRLIEEASAGQLSMFATESQIDIVEDMVRVVIECETGQADTVAQEVQALGALIEVDYSDLLQITVPVSTLVTISEIPGVTYVRLPMEPNYFALTSQGVSLVNADDWQTAGYSGEGMKVAILDGGFSGYTSLLGSELPSTVTVQSFNSAYGIDGGSEHGTACAEIVYDMAPDAQMYLVNCGTMAEFGSAVNWLIQQDVDVITCSIGWNIGSPGDGTGYLCEAVDSAVDSGIFWSQAAGNLVQSHWAGQYSDGNGDGWNDFDPDYFPFNYTYLYPGDVIYLELKWDDQYGTCSTDYDLYLYYADDQQQAYIEVANSKYRQNGQGGDDYPDEYIAYQAPVEGYYMIGINKYYATRNVNFHLYSYPYPMYYYTAAGSLTIPADSVSATTVGAVYYSDPATIENFSSQGPTEDGRLKPDLVAPDGVSNSSINPFYGTSASTPHVAGAAVLVKQKYPGYTPAQIQGYLETNAVELGAAGKDNVFGSGRLLLAESGMVVTTVEHNPAMYGLTSDYAELPGELVSMGSYSSVDVCFEWGTDPGNLDQTTATYARSATGLFSAAITDLTPNTTYYYRAKATAGSETVYGAVESVTTEDVPLAVISGNASDVSGTAATLSGLVTRLGYSSGEASFVWGTVSGNLDHETTPVSVTETGGYTADISGLTPGETYYFKAKLASEGYDVYGDEVMFRTTHPLYQEGMIAYWNFDESAGAVAVDVVNYNDGSITGATYVPGISGNALSFDGDGDYVVVPYDDSLAFSGNGTIEFWVKPEGEGGPILFSESDIGEVIWQYYYYTDTVRLDAGLEPINTMHVIPDPVSWTHVVTVFEDNVFKLYINGVCVKEAQETNEILQGLSPEGFTAISSDIFFGKNSSEYFEGSIDEVVLWETSLTQEEILQRFNAGIAAVSDLTVSTVQASEITQTSAVLNGGLLGLGSYDSADISFEWGETDGGPYPNTTVPFEVTSAGTYSTTIDSLSSVTEYFYRVKVDTTDGIVTGSQSSFRTSRVFPELVTLEVTDINIDSVTLRGRIDDFGDFDQVKVSFVISEDPGGPYPEYYLVTENETTRVDVFSTGEFSAVVTGLQQGVTYYYKARVTGNIYEFMEYDLNFYSEEKSFVAGQPSFGVTTQYADSITANEATLLGYLSGLGDFPSAQVSFEWGSDPGLLDQTTAAQTMTETGAFFADITGLDSNTPYFFRAKAVAGEETIYGSVGNFTSAMLPPVIRTVAASDITRNSACLNGYLLSMGDCTSVNVQFCWGTESGSPSGYSPLIPMTAVGACSYNVTGLSSNTTYYYKAVVIIDGAVGNGDELSFLTLYPESISVLPDNPGIYPGETQSFSAILTNSDDSTENVTDNVTWSSSSTSIAEIDTETGIATALHGGQTVITADWGGFEEPAGADKLTITIDSSKIDSSLTHFPVLLHLGGESGINGLDVSRIFDEIGGDYQRIAVTDADGLDLYVEVERWDEVAEEAWLWVSAPHWTIHGTEDTMLYLYYGSMMPENTSRVGLPGSVAAQHVWDDYYVLVDHMQDGVSPGDTIDSTFNNNDGTKSGSGMPTQVSGKIGYEQDYVSGERVTVDDTDALSGMDQLTVELIVASSTTDIGLMTFISKYYHSVSREWVFQSRIQQGAWADGLNFLIFDENNDGYISKHAFATILDGSYHHVAGTYTSVDDSINLYKDGSQLSTNTINSGTFTSVRNTNQPVLYARQQGLDRDFIGAQDEIRLSNIARSAAWMKATYATCWDDLASYDFETQSLPAALSGSTVLTVYSSMEINGGNPVVMLPGDVITSSQTSGIPIGVTGLPDMGQPVNGPAHFEIEITWDTDTIQVDSIDTASDGINRGWSMTPGVIDLLNGSITMSGDTANYSIDDVTFFNLGITAVGAAGTTGEIHVAMTSFEDKDSVSIMVAPANMTVVMTQQGDANGDGLINAFDITAIARMILGYDAETSAGDTNQDGFINVLDIAKLVRIILGIE